MGSLPAEPPGKPLGTGYLVPKHLCLRAAGLASDTAWKCILETSEKFSALVRSAFQSAQGLAANPRPSRGFYCPGLNSGDHFRAKRTYECQVLAEGMFQELSEVSWCETWCTHHAETEWIQLKIFKRSFFQFSSVTQLCSALCDPKDCNMAGFPVHYQLLELFQTRVHWVSDAIQPSHPLSSLSPPAFNLSHHQGLFKWHFFASGGQSVGASASASVLPKNIQDWFPLGWTGLSPCCPRDCQESSPTPQFKTSILQHSTFFMVQLSHPHLTTQEKFPEYLPSVKHRSLFLGLQRGKRQIPAQTCGRINKCTMNHSARWGLGPRMSRRNTDSMGPRLG